MKIKKFKINILYFENKKNNLYEILSNISPDFIICCGFPKKIPKDIINLPRFCSINLHGGKVPEYLGGSTLNWQIINGERKIFISSIKMNHKIDGGPLILQESINIEKISNIDIVKIKLNKVFPRLCLKSIDHILKNKKLKYFSKSKKKFWKQRSKNDSRIDINNYNKKYVYNLIKASSKNNYPAFIEFKDKKIFLYKSQILKKFSKSNKKYFIKNKTMFVNFKDGILKVDKFKIIKK